MKKIFCYVMFILFAISCKEKYESPVDSPPTGYLVVEGVVNSNGPTTIMLTHTRELGVRDTLFERGAIVRVEGENNIGYTLPETSKGRYTIPALTLNSSQKYRLHIKTNLGKEYFSDYIPVKTNPPIDDITWTRDNNGLQIYVNTHDPQDNTRYYQWEYVETWEFHSKYLSSLKYKISYPPPDNKYKIEAVFRDSSSFGADMSIYLCWQSEISSALQLGSSAKLTKDIINLPLLVIPSASYKLSVLYSVAIKQYAWSKEGYEFMEKMKKNTELVGSIFDAQPSELKGNIHSASDPEEPVIGFFNICNIQERRFFISNSQVPNWGYSQSCNYEVMENHTDSIDRKSAGRIPTEVVEQIPGGGIATFGVSDVICVDCTKRGTNIKPVFWP